MSAPTTIKKYLRLLERLLAGNYPSFEELRLYLGEEFGDVPERTLQRLIAGLREHFGVQVQHVREKNGYAIVTDDGTDTGTLLRFLELIGTAELLADNVEDSRSVLPYLMLENQGNLRGIENLRLLLPAVQGRKKVSFEHFNYHHDKVSSFDVKPYLLKEYQGRWYLVGFVDKLDAFRTFGLDRISKLHVGKQTFRRTAEDPRQKFEEVIGLTYEAGELQDVEIEVDDLQRKYLESLPLHRTQTISRLSAEKYVVKLRVKINYELVQRILMLGEHATVRKPDILKKQVKEILGNMLSRYKEAGTPPERPSGRAGAKDAKQAQRTQG